MASSYAVDWFQARTWMWRVGERRAIQSNSYVASSVHFASMLNWGKNDWAFIFAPCCEYYINILGSFGASNLDPFSAELFIGKLAVWQPKC